MKERILITGGRGFIGSRLSELLAGLGARIIMADVANGVDLREPNSFRGFSGIDVVIHLAALKSVPESFKDPWLYLSNNYMATLGALEICRTTEARMIYISSYLYGPPQYLPIDEAHPLVPHNPYAQSKLVSEQLCMGYNRDYGVPVTIFRPFNLYGPELRDNSLIPTIIRQLNSGEVVVLDPLPKRDYLYIDDLCAAVIKSVGSFPDTLQVINLGSGKSISVEELVRLIIDLGKARVVCRVELQRRQGEVMDCVADITEAKRVLAWKPSWSLEDGLLSVLRHWGFGGR